MKNSMGGFFHKFLRNPHPSICGRWDRLNRGMKIKKRVNALSKDKRLSNIRFKVFQKPFNKRS